MKALIIAAVAAAVLPVSAMQIEQPTEPTYFVGNARIGNQHVQTAEIWFQDRRGQQFGMMVICARDGRAVLYQIGPVSERMDVETPEGKPLFQADYTYPLQKGNPKVSTDLTSIHGQATKACRNQPAWETFR